MGCFFLGEEAEEVGGVKKASSTALEQRRRYYVLQNTAFLNNVCTYQILNDIKLRLISKANKQKVNEIIEKYHFNILLITS
jgi:hypothetical protein